MNLIDSFGRIEYFGEWPLAEKYASYVESATPENTITPTVVLFEVYRRIKTKKGEKKALEAIAQMIEANIVEQDQDIALAAADASLQTGLGMADSIALATVRKFGAQVLTIDRHFEKITGVKVIR